MKNRRILTHSNLEPDQIRSVDPFSGFNSDNVNCITKISHKTNQPDIIISGYDVIENCNSSREYFSQELINFDRFKYTNNCKRSDTNSIEVYTVNNDVEDIHNGYAEQDLSQCSYLDTKRYFNNNLIKTFFVSFSLSNGTPKNLYLSIGDTVYDFKYLDGSYDTKTNKYTVVLNVNFKNVTDKLTFKIGSYIDKLDYRNFYSTHHEIDKDIYYTTISNISCKMLIRDFSNEYPLYTSDDNWTINHTHLYKSLKITPGVAVKDNVVLNALQSVNLGNSAVVLPLNESRSWIHNNPYTIHDFYRNSKTEMLNVKIDTETLAEKDDRGKVTNYIPLVIKENHNLRYQTSVMNEDGNLSVTLRNVHNNTIRSFPLSDFNSNVGKTITINASSVVETEDYVSMTTNTSIIQNDFCGNTLIVSVNDKIVTKIDVTLTSQTCQPVTFKIPRKDFTSLSDVKVILSNALLKVAKDSKHCLWGYVVCYYSYFKNPNPNRCYIGLIRESDYLRDGYTEDYLVLAKVRFVDPNTIDLIQYLDNRNNYSIDTARDINYIVDFNNPDIWYHKNPITLADAINYSQILRYKVLKRFKLKSDKDSNLSTALRITNKDLTIDNKRVSIDTQSENVNTKFHLERRVCEDHKRLKIITIFNDSQLRSEMLSSCVEWFTNRIVELCIKDLKHICEVYYEKRIDTFLSIDDYSFRFINDIDKFLCKQFTNIVKDHEEFYEDFEKYLKDQYSESQITQFSKNLKNLVEPYVSNNESIFFDKYYFEWKATQQKWFTYDFKWAISSDLGTFGRYEVTYNTISKQCFCFNKYGPFRFINPRTSETIIELDWIYSSLRDCQLPQSFSDYDIAKDDSYLVSYYPKDHKDNDDLYIDSNNELLNSQHNHFSYLIFREQFLTSKYLVKMLDMFPITEYPDYLIDGRILEGLDGHIKSSIHKLSLLTDKNLINCEVKDDYDIIKSVTYWISTDNFKTKGKYPKKENPKLLQDNHVIICDTRDGRKEIQSSNYIIDDLEESYVLISQTDSNGVIHIRNTKTKFSASMIDENTVIGRVYPDYQQIDTDKYYISTTNLKTDGNNKKLLQDNQILIACNEGTRTSIESSNIVIDDHLKDNYVIVSNKDDKSIIHIQSSNIEISKNLTDNNLITSIDKDSDKFIKSTKYEISTKNRRTISSQDKLLQNGQLLTCYKEESDTKSIQSSNIVIDNDIITDVNDLYYLKISDTDNDGVVHIKKSNKVINELLYDLCYLPKHIEIRQNKVHITISCDKKFRITTSQILSEIQKSLAYQNVFNYDIDVNNPLLFTVVLHIDMSNISNDVDRGRSDDKSFNVIGNDYKSEILIINDIGLSEAKQHIVTEQERIHGVTEDSKRKHLVLENSKKRRFRSCIAIEYVINNNTEILNNKIHWIDEWKGYDTNIEEYTFEPDRPHIVDYCDNIEYIFSVDDIFYGESGGNNSINTFLIDDIDIYDSIDDVDIDDDPTTDSDDIDEIWINETDDITISSSYTCNDIEEVGDIIDVDTIVFKAFDTDRTVVDNVELPDFDCDSIDVIHIDPVDDAKSGFYSDDVDITKIISEANNISLYRRHDSLDSALDLSSFMNLYPCRIDNQKWANVIRSKHGWGDVRGPIENIYAQTKARIKFDISKNESSPIRNLVPGITFSNTDDSTIYASSETYNIE